MTMDEFEARLKAFGISLPEADKKPLLDMVAEIDRAAAQVREGSRPLRRDGDDLSDRPADRRCGMSAKPLTIAEASRLIRDKKLSPVELTQDCLNRIAALDGQLDSFILLLADEALAQAKQAEAEIAKGQSRGAAARHPARAEGHHRLQGPSDYRPFSRAEGQRVGGRRLRHRAPARRRRGHPRQARDLGVRHRRAVT